MSFIVSRFKSILGQDDGRSAFRRSNILSSDIKETKLTWESIMVDERNENSNYYPLFKSSFFPKRKICLPKKIKTLVLDLDETLVHSTSRNVGGYDHMIEVMLDGQACLYYVYKRPHLDAFLRQISQWFHLCIFTASLMQYADPVIDWLDRGQNMFSSRFFRNSCIETNGSYTKDLSLVSDDLSSMILIDNSPISYLINPCTTDCNLRQRHPYFRMD